MQARWHIAVPALLVLLAVFGVAAVHAAPDGSPAIGIWPVGLASGALLLAPRRAWPVVVPALLVVSVATVLVGGRPLDVSLGYGVAGVLEALLVAGLLKGLAARRPEAWSLRTDGDLYAYLFACTASAVLGSVLAAATASATGDGHPGLAATAVGVAALASQLSLVPIFVRLPRHQAVAGRFERALQWGVLIGVTFGVFVLGGLPSLVFIVVPVLAWGALRTTPVEAIGQMLAVQGVAIELTTAGRGPLADLPARYGLAPDARGVVLSAFVATCALIVVPVVVRVGEYVGAVDEVRRERDLVRSIVDAATGVAIMVADEDDNIVLFNPGAERLLGWRADEIVGRSFRTMRTDDAVREVADRIGLDDPTRLAEVLSAGGHPDTPMRLLRKDGVERVHSLTMNRIQDAEGRPIGLVSVSEDITDRLAAQQALEDALATERAAAERLREVDAVKDQLVSTVSHELRTPLTSILGYLEMLGDGALGGVDDQARAALLRVSANSQRLLRLIEDLLTLSRSSAETEVDEAPFDLREALLGARDVVAPQWGPPRQLRLAWDLPDEPVPVSGDRDMLERVVVNLLSNAVKFTPDGGSIGVHLRHSTGRAEVVVHDTGVGIPADEQDQLFNRFFRSRRAQGEAIQGTGLGLSISKAIVERHGGRIWATSQDGAGTSVTFELPTLDSLVSSTRRGND